MYKNVSYACIFERISKPQAAKPVNVSNGIFIKYVWMRKCCWYV